MMTLAKFPSRIPFPVNCLILSGVKFFNFTSRQESQTLQHQTEDRLKSYEAMDAFPTAMS
ncbi:MAG: hypothetical protein O4861_05695 [Trichodesmium sp. St16_bin4-tuft]|nr:hypothetical protein [Trichodesmium sp. St4_bin8_1]MDE5074301.1 hypothetical protein [Trichodesmium sp. St5_bin8]MDE5097857.1 hypothetical protein [Trichodesmium sp. St16_bin4-tuft]